MGSIDKAIFGTADLFIAEGTVTVKDDCGLQVEEADFTDDFYGSLIGCMTRVSDWVFMPHLQSGMIIVCGIRELWYQHFVCIAESENSGISTVCVYQRTLVSASRAHVRELWYWYVCVHQRTLVSALCVCTSENSGIGTYV